MQPSRLRKNSFWALLAISSVSALPSLVWAGGNSDGTGGDYPRSTPEQIESSLGQATEDVINIVSFFGRGDNERLPYRVENRRIEFIGKALFSELQKKFGFPDPTSSHLDYDKIKAFVKARPVCQDHEGTKRSGATALGKVGSPICISISDLVSIPKEALYNHLRALIAHELAHQAGFGQSDAILFQNYLISFSEGRAKSGIRWWVHWEFAKQVRIVKSDLQNGAPKTKLCAEIGALSALSFQLGVNRNNMDRGAENSTTENEAIKLLDDLTYRDIRSYCGAELVQSNDLNSPVCQGDTNDLRQTIDTLDQATPILEHLLAGDESQIPRSNEVRERMALQSLNTPCRAVFAVPGDTSRKIINGPIFPLSSDESPRTVPAK